MDPCTNVSRSPPVRVVDVRGQKLKAHDKLSFSSPQRKIRLLSKGRGEVLPDSFFGNGLATNTKLNMSHKCCEDTISRQVKSDGCAQHVQLTQTSLVPSDRAAWSGPMASHLCLNGRGFFSLTNESEASWCSNSLKLHTRAEQLAQGSAVRELEKLTPASGQESFAAERRWKQVVFSVRALGYQPRPHVEVGNDSQAALVFNEMFKDDLYLPLLMELDLKSAQLQTGIRICFESRLIPWRAFFAWDDVNRIFGVDILTVHGREKH